MSSEIHKIKQEIPENKENLFNAEVINFPNDKKFTNFEVTKIVSNKIWRITDPSCKDQLKAVNGICFIFSALFLMGLYSIII